jgi:glyceraldehyde-3-phosphate dehydrogenase (NADP+)
VVIIEPYSDFTAAVAELNHSRYGLQAGVFTDSISEMDYAFNNIEVGGLMINEIPTFRMDHMPYGGVKDSGLGREGVKYAILDMMEPRLMVKG